MAAVVAVAVVGWAPAGSAAPAPPAAVSRAAGGQWRPRTSPAPAALRPGELIVKTARGRSSSIAVARVGGRSTASLGGGAELVKVPAGREVALAQRLDADPSVVYAEPNYIRTAASHSTGELTWGVRMTNAPSLWHHVEPATGRGVRVAVVDSGVDRGHPQLAKRVLRGYDVYGTKGRDECGHGTAVAGVIAAGDGDGSIVGVAPDASIVPVKVLRYDSLFGMCVGDDAAVVQGLRWAAQSGRADIINLSLSGPQPSRALADAVGEATRHGVLVVAASGNSGDRTINYPAAYPGVLSVGGLQRSSTGPRWWRHSSFGKVDAAAPARAVPVLRATGVRAASVGRSCPARDVHPLCADGTSFAAPHVTGVAALLHERHGQALQTATPRARLRRVRQWVLGTAPDVSGVRRGVSLHTGHGYPDARAADTASGDTERTLVTWQTQPRVLAPTSKMRVLPSARRLTVVATDGTGTPLSGRTVGFHTPLGGSLSVTSGQLDAGGRLSTVFRSRADGRRPVVHADVDGTSLATEAYVLQRDENIPGVRLRPSGYRGRLDAVYDADDVFRVRLKEGETLRADARRVDPRREFVDLYLHRGTTTDVTNPRLAPLRERGATFQNDPRRLRVTVATDGRRYLDVYGTGSYRLVWWIVSPGMVANASASPATFSPNGDGYRDRTAIRWRVRRRGTVVLRVRNSAGRVVRTVRFGTISRGRKMYRWDGRNGRGGVVRDGRYRATLHWAGAGGRRATTSTRVVVDR